MKRNAFIIAAGAGLAAGLVMTIVGHYVPFVRDKVFAIGGMLIAMVAGFIYARIARGAWRDSLIGGALSGAVGALLAIVASVVLGDVPAFVILVGTAASIVTGLIGGAIGKLIG
jgi:hypothetical protein